jgi:hypothetical protein
MIYARKFALLIALFSFSIIVPSQSLFENATSESGSGQKFPIDFNGYGRGSAYGGSPSFDYSNVFAEFTIQGKLSVDRAYLFTDLRFRYGLKFDSLAPEFELKETYAGYQSDKLDVYLGAKIITWGRSDGFNPTDNITPYDYFFLSGNPDDQKLPNFLMQAKWYFSPSSNLELVMIPFYRPSIYRFDLFDLGELTTFTDPTLPAKTFRNGSIGGRFNYDSGKIGFSLSYFRGYDPYYGFNIKKLVVTPEGIVPPIELSAMPYQKSTFGADLAVPAGSWIFRLEAAYNQTKDHENNMHIPNPGIQYTAGIEHSFWDIVTILQYIGSYTIDFVSFDDMPPPQNGVEMIVREFTEFNRRIFYQQEQTNHALSLSLNRSFRYETIRIEATGYYNITSEEWLIRPKLAWKINDHLETSIGGFYSEGPDKTLFYYASDVMNGAFIELKANF